MKIPELLCLILILHLQLYMLSVESLKCYVCNDCEIYYNETHLIQCDTEDRCIKTIEADTDIVARDCGNKKLCTKEGSSPPPTGRSAKNKKRKSEKFKEAPRNPRNERSPPLLSPETKTTTGSPPPLISELHCCDDVDGCNGAARYIKLHILSVVPFFVSVTWSNLGLY